MEVKELIGRTIVSISVGDETYINCSDGSKWRFYHEQDCCESVTLTDSHVMPNVPCNILDASYDCETGEEEYGDTWTKSTYTFETNEGPMILEWIGTSNGYYSEDVCLQRMTNDGYWRSFYLDQKEEFNWL